MGIKLFYFVQRFGHIMRPAFLVKSDYDRLKKFEQNCDQNELSTRLSYYLRLTESFPVPTNAIAVKDFKRKGRTDYFLDLKEFLLFFSAEVRFAYQFGDSTEVYPAPTLIKARPIDGDNANSVLFKLNKNRHFQWVNDSISFAEKKDELVWRGGAYQKLRRVFVEKFWNHPSCNVGQTNSPKEDVPWQGEFLSISEQLNYKFIFCPEGNDVATNLKWAMSSNSLCFMPKPKFETWFMEGILESGVHYVEVASDFSDVEEKINYYSTHPPEAESIIRNAHAHVNRFRNRDMEDLLCLKVLEEYARLSGQKSSSRFS